MNNTQEHIKSALNKYFERVEEETVLHIGEFLIDGKWCFPRYGCDSLQKFMDEIRETKSDDKLLKTIDMELALARYFNSRSNIIVPNVSWGMDTHECDLFILTRAGYGREVEIKVTKADLIKDKEKKHGHFSTKIKFLDFAIPDYLEEFIYEIPDRAGVILVDSKKEWRWCKRVRRPVRNSNYKYSDGERLQLARLGAMRIWGLKRKISNG